MASRRAYIRDEGKSIGSLSDDEEPDEQQHEGLGVVRLPTLRSMIVLPKADDAVPEEGDDDGGREPAWPASRIPRHRDDGNAAAGKPTGSHESHHVTSRSKENRRRADIGDNYGPAYGLSSSQRGEANARNAKVSEANGMRRDFRSRGERRDKHWNGEHDSSSNLDRDGERRAVSARFRDSHHDRDRPVQRRDTSQSPRRYRRRDFEKGSPRRDGKEREMARSPDEDSKYDDADTENDAKGKAKQRDVRRDRDGGGYHVQNHVRDRDSHRDRDASPASGDAEGGSRSPLAAGKGSSRVGRNWEDRGKGWEGGDGQGDGRSGRRETIRERDGGRETIAPELYSIHKATVHSIRPFGIFVRMDGYRNHGLVHLGQISHHEVTNRKDSDEKKVESISSVVSEREQVWVKVISVQHEEDGKVKVGCSLKLVSQGDGKDLDPNNLQLEKYQSKGPWQPPKKFELDAVYNVSCTRCGGHGHLKKECYSTGDKTYELLEDADAEDDDGRGSKVAASVVVPTKLALGAGPSSKPPSGPAGRGRAMVQPAWMTHGIGIGGDQEHVLRGHISSKSLPDLPETVTSLEDALAILEMAKEEKRNRRLERLQRKHRKRDKKHGSREFRKEKHKRRHRSDDDDHRRSRKKLRAY